MLRRSMLLFVLAACTDPAPPQPKTTVSVVEPASVPASVPVGDMPAWTASSKVTVDNDKGVIRAVGSAPAGKMNLQLARDAAENRARAMIVEHKHGKVDGKLEGARMIDSYVKDGKIYVLVEAPLH
jgi:hypothetical protein